MLELIKSLFAGDSDDPKCRRCDVPMKVGLALQNTFVTGLPDFPGDPARGTAVEDVDPDHKDAVFAYTVCRDLRWDVQKVNIVAAFHPYKDRPPLSTGMMDEIGHARAFRKERYLLLPSGGGSPFTEGNYIPKGNVFTHEKDFFNHLEKKRKSPLKARFKKYVQAIKSRKTRG